MNFEKLVLSLDDHWIQKTLREVDSQVLSYAICHESSEVQAKFLANVSARAAEMLREDISYILRIISAVDKLEREIKAQDEIIEIISRLAYHGEIIVDHDIFDELPVYHEKNNDNLSQKDINKKHDAIADLIQAIETAINSDGRLNIQMPHSTALSVMLDMERAFDFFRERADDLMRIKEIIFTFNIKSLPTWLRTLKSLESLDIRSEDLPQVPEWISEFDLLQRLTIMCSYIVELPESICNLKCLAELNLSDNAKLKSLPDSIENLTTLKSLNISSTGIDCLPEAIGNLSTLEIFNLEHTPVTILPDSIFNLKSLRYLNLSYTGLKKLPPSIEKLKSLRKLELYGLPIDKRDIPYELSSNENLDISLSYSMIPSDEPFFYEDYVNTYKFIAAKACYWSKLARHEGLLALEKSLEVLKHDDFFYTGLRFVTDGTDACVVSSILSNIIEHENDPYKIILMEIMEVAVLSIQAGEDSLHLLIRLNSMANIKDDPITLAITDYFITGDKDAFDLILREMAEQKEPLRRNVEDTEIVRFIKRAAMMHEAAENGGITSLENLVIREKGVRDIFEYGISLAIDKYSIEMIEEILDNLISHETEPAMKTLAIMKEEAVLDIANGTHRNIFLMNLVSLYSNNIEEFKEYLKGSIR
jgi:flagellar motor component MotA